MRSLSPQPSAELSIITKWTHKVKNLLTGRLNVGSLSLLKTLDVNWGVLCQEKSFELRTSLRNFYQFNDLMISEPIS